jgi:hypothetical protein
MAKAARLLVVMGLLLALTACEEKGASAEPFPEACRLPSPPADLDDGEVQGLFVLEEAVVRNVVEEKDLLIVAMNVPFGVQETFDGYKEAIEDAPYDLIGEDFEGFEGELYLRERTSGELVSIQIRRPNCNEASSVTVNLHR